MAKLKAEQIKEKALLEVQIIAQKAKLDAQLKIKEAEQEADRKEKEVNQYEFELMKDFYSDVSSVQRNDDKEKEAILQHIKQDNLLTKDHTSARRVKEWVKEQNIKREPDEPNQTLWTRNISPKHKIWSILKLR